MLACRGAYFSGALWLIGTNGFALLIPWLLKLAIDALRQPHRAAHSPTHYALLIIGAALLGGCVRIFSRTTLLHAGRRIEFLIREDLYAKLLTMDLPYFSRERTGDILSRFANDLTNVRMLLGFGVLNVINTTLIYLVALTLMVRLSPLLTVLAILPFPVMIFVVKRLSAAMFRRSKRTQEELAKLTSAVEENVSAAAVIKAYCREDAAIATFAEASGRYMASNMRVAQLRGFMIPVMAATGALGTLIVLLMGGQQVVEKTLTLGEFVAFSGYLAMLIWPTIILGWILNLIQRGAASMSRLNEVLQAEAQVQEPENPVVKESIAGDIRISGLSFAYGSELLLQDISLSVPAGSRLGIVGPIGAGKSTLVKLLARLYPVPDGVITIDGIDANESSVPNPQSNLQRLNPDNVQEFRTVTLGATAETGAQCNNNTNEDAGDDSVVNDGCPAVGDAESIDVFMGAQDVGMSLSKDAGDDLPCLGLRVQLGEIARGEQGPPLGKLVVGSRLCGKPGAVGVVELLEVFKRRLVLPRTGGSRSICGPYF